MDLDIIARMIFENTSPWIRMNQSLGLPIVMMPKKYHEKGAETPTKLGT